MWQTATKTTRRDRRPTTSQAPGFCENGRDRCLRLRIRHAPERYAIGRRNDEKKPRVRCAANHRGAKRRARCVFCRRIGANGFRRGTIRCHDRVPRCASDGWHRCVLRGYRASSGSARAANRHGVRLPRNGKKGARSRRAFHLCAFPLRELNGCARWGFRFARADRSSANAMSDGFA